MYYSENEARRLVIEAGHKLLENKLIARTWGNISARTGKDEFIITPSGRAYDTLTPDDLVKVKVADCSYTGSIKPSEADRAIPTDTGTGLIPAEMAAVIARGPIMLVAAV